MHAHSTTVPVARGRVYKHTESHARRLVSTMTSDKTPATVRRKLRRALERLAACTDLPARRSLNKVSNVALVLACTGLRHIREDFYTKEARRARVALCGVMSDYERQAYPWRFPWLHRETESSRPRARRAVRPRKATTRPAPLPARAAA